MRQVNRLMMAPVLATADTPLCLFSGSKAISAMLVHKLAEDIPYVRSAFNETAVIVSKKELLVEYILILGKSLFTFS